jgi:hypothetical protein
MSEKNPTQYEAPSSHTLGGDECADGPGRERDICSVGGELQATCLPGLEIPPTSDNP